MREEGKYYCPPDDCGEYIAYHGKVRYNNNLINITRKPRYAAAFWSPEGYADVFISSFNFKKSKTSDSIYGIYKDLNEEEIEREGRRYDLGFVSINSEISFPGLLGRVNP
ncbi:hypothetical protein P1P68_17585 [Streptomyces scabiei]|uniref:hypothetical protein n=1 Tax=Streptomyces scabiei TaxID=1930 RepID=UPI0029907547|nr:hypothetical protein [Streptomyces scabiei]MDW8806553.1 hypothetical protein [Streptomyces scabiei]